MDRGAGRVDRGAWGCIGVHMRLAMPCKGAVARILEGRILAFEDAPFVRFGPLAKSKRSLPTLPGGRPRDAGARRDGG